MSEVAQGSGISVAFENAVHYEYRCHAILAMKMMGYEVFARPGSRSKLDAFRTKSRLIPTTSVMGEGHPIAMRESTPSSRKPEVIIPISDRCDYAHMTQEGLSA